MLRCSICWAFPALKRLRLNPCVKEKSRSKTPGVQASGLPATLHPTRPQ